MNQSPVDNVGVIPLAYGGPGGRQAAGSAWRVPPGRPMAVTAGVATLLTLYAAVPPGGFLGSFLLAVVAWVGVGGTWAVRLVGRLVITPGPPAEARRAAAEVAWWLVVPLLFLTAVVLDGRDVPYDVTFRLNRPAMERVARSALAQPSTMTGPVGLGLYGSVYPEVDGSAVYLPVSGTGFLNTHGFVYSPNGPPRRGRCRPLGGPWYEWHQKF